MPLVAAGGLCGSPATRIHAGKSVKELSCGAELVTQLAFSTSRGSQGFGCVAQDVGDPQSSVGGQLHVEIHPPFSCARFLYAAQPSNIMWVPGRHHCWIIGTSVCTVLSGTTCMQRPLSCSMAAKTDMPFTRRPLWNFRRKKYDLSISITMASPLLSWV